MTLLGEMTEFRIKLRKNTHSLLDKSQTNKGSLIESFGYLKRMDSIFHSFYQDFYTFEENDQDIYNKLRVILLEVISLLKNLSIKLEHDWKQGHFGEIPYPQLEENNQFRIEILEALKKRKDPSKRVNALPMYRTIEKSRDLFVIHAHSSETKKMCKIPEGIHLFHYCKSGCKLLSYSQKNHVNSERYLSREMACLGEIDIHDHFKNTAPYYSFSGDNVRHGIFKCEHTRHGHRMIKIHDIPFQMTLLEVLLHIQSYRVYHKSLDIQFDLGIMSCRGGYGCNGEIHAITPHRLQMKNRFSNNLNRGYTQSNNLHPMKIDPEHPELFSELFHELEQHKTRPVSRPVSRIVPRPVSKPGTRHVSKKEETPGQPSAPKTKRVPRTVKSLSNRPSSSPNLPYKRENNWDPFSNLDKSRNKKPFNRSNHYIPNSTMNPMNSMKRLTRTRSSTIQPPNLTSNLKGSKNKKNLFKTIKRILDQSIETN